MRIDEATENPFDPGTHPRKYWTFEGQRKKQLADRKRRREIQTRVGKIKLYEVIGRLIWNANSHGYIFDIQTGEMVRFSERPGLFVQVAITQATKEAEEYVKRRSEQNN